MARSYATSADVIGWAGSDLGVTARQLERANRQVSHATRFARYDTDPTGYPLDPDLQQALRDAVCAQAVALHADSQPGDSSAFPTDRLISAKLGGADYTLAPVPVTAAPDVAAGELDPEADEILRAAGLLNVHVIGY